MNAEIEKNESIDHKESGLELKYSIDSILLNIYEILEDENLENNKVDIFTDFEFEIDKSKELNRKNPDSLGEYLQSGSVVLKTDFNNDLIRKINLFMHLYETEYRDNKWSKFLNKKFSKEINKKEVDIDFTLVEKFLYKITDNKKEEFIDVQDILKANNILISMLMYAGVKKKDIYRMNIKKEKWKK